VETPRKYAEGILVPGGTKIARYTDHYCGRRVPLQRENFANGPSPNRSRVTAHEQKVNARTSAVLGASSSG